MKDVTSTSFGYVIGFLLPGMVALYGLSFMSKNISALIQPVLTPNATVGSSLLFLLAALTLGLLVSALRFLLFEKLLCRKHTFAEGFFQQLKVADKLSSFKSVVDEHYRYHQFYGGFAVAFIPVFVGWLWQNHASYNHWIMGLWIFAFLVVEAVVIYSGKNSYERYVDRANQVVQS